jgi:putative flavoprotein involved in K+ transport
VSVVPGAAGPAVTFPAGGSAAEGLGGHHSVVIVGGGQAGLAASWALVQRGIDHVVLERDRLASSWREQRWDSFCLVTPNWQCQLPGHPYDGDDPDGFMAKDAIIDYLERYADRFGPPLREGVEVTLLTREDGRFVVATTRGELTADHVVLAVGGHHVPKTPLIAGLLASDLTQLHSSQYRNPAALPDGAVLVVGSGQSGAQIAEDLHLAGRQVHLSVSSAPRAARRYRGRDCVAWLHDIGHYRMTIGEHPKGLSVRGKSNHYLTGRGGGRDIDLRAFAREGMRLHGRLLRADGARLGFAADLESNLDAADARSDRIKDTIDRWILENGIDAPGEARYEPVWRPRSDGGEPLDLDAARVRSVIWATGFRSEWSWVRAAVFDDGGYPVHERGITPVDGLGVLGLPWLHRWGSGRFAGIADDARHLADHIAARMTAGVLASGRSA